MSLFLCFHVEAQENIVEAMDSMKVEFKAKLTKKKIKLAPGMKDSSYLANARIYNSLGDALKDPSKVYKFQLAYLDDLRRIPEELFELGNIQVLEIRFLPRLMEVPAEIKKLKHLLSYLNKMGSLKKRCLIDQCTGHARFSI
ncbi:MAG TPA: hypothetical protein EYQ86_07505 [Bacteroidetes bacterium]|nr:hypothetical protein [Bacteroidota bacterium]